MKDEHCKTLSDDGPFVTAETQWQHGYPGRQGILEGFKYVLLSHAAVFMLYELYRFDLARLVRSLAHGCYVDVSYVMKGWKKRT